MPTIELEDPPEPAPDADEPATPELIIVGSDDAPVCTDGVCLL